MSGAADGECEAQSKRPRRLGWILVAAAALALTAMLAAACGGGGDPQATVDSRATVEASLRHYFSTFRPEDSVFPTGAGPPSVKDNDCKDLHRKLPLVLPGSTRLQKGEKKIALWQCFVRFKSFTLTVEAGVNDRSEVIYAMPVYGDGRKAPELSPARTYTG